ncbi:MAG TPA: VIT domain-containing protein [Sphingomonas sp.]|jgi:hypothetical protein
MTSLAYRLETRSAEAPPFGAASLIFGSILPAGVIVLELFTGLCAGTFFDPLPTAGHLLLAGSVPIINGTLWWGARERASGRRVAVIAAGAALAVALAYSVLFLPMLPFAAIGIIFFGVGLLPFSPVFATIVAYRLGRDAAVDREHGHAELWAGVALGAVAMVLVDLPATATHLALKRYGGTPEERDGAVSLMRRLGDRELLLRSAYGDTQRATGLVSLALAGGLSTGPDLRSDRARELYFRITGQAFNSVPRPGHGLRDDLSFGWDEDQGGSDVGGRVDALSIRTSRIDGSAALRDNLAYLEWTMEIANRDPVAREARIVLALPEGAVASRATLWVDGEPREASVAGRAETRAAYRSVVSTRRDPLLVTTDGAQRLLVQVFPVPADGQAKIRIGFTAPFRVAPDGRRDLALPAIVDGNFAPGNATRHSLWVEADGPLRATEPGLQVGGTTISGDVSGADLVRRPRLLAPALTRPLISVGAAPATAKAPALAVMQKVERIAPLRPGVLMLVLDGSVGNRRAAEALPDALDVIPTGVPVGIAVADDQPTLVAPAPWSPRQKERVVAAIRAARFRGGHDDRDALAAALAHAAGPSGPAGAVLWVHGAQPVDLAETTARLEQTLDRSTRLPRLVRLQSEPGRARSLEGEPLFDTARLVTPTRDFAADLRGVLAELSGATATWRVVRNETTARGAGSAHVVRLWAAERIAARSGATGPGRDEAIRLAHRLNLVTTLSGAVVLETDKDYERNGLPVPGAEEVPTVPEPETWALIGMVALLSMWLLRRQSGTVA